MSEIGVTVAQEFMPASRVSVHRATGVYSPGMEGVELESQIADADGSVTFSTLSGLEVESGDKLWVIGRNPAGAPHCVSMTAKTVRSAESIKAAQERTRSAHEDDGATVVTGARTTQNTKPAARKASPRKRTGTKKAPAKKAAGKSSGSSKK